MGGGGWEWVAEGRERVVEGGSGWWRVGVGGGGWRVGLIECQYRVTAKVHKRSLMYSWCSDASKGPHIVAQHTTPYEYYRHTTAPCSLVSPEATALVASSQRC